MDCLPLFFKAVAHGLSYPVSKLFNLILSTAKIPLRWKQAYVLPLFKKGKACCPENYRPISLTCILCKVFESIIKDSLLYYFHTNHILHDFQHGFLAGASTCINLLSCEKMIGHL